MIKVTFIVNDISLNLELSTEETVEQIKNFLVENLEKILDKKDGAVIQNKGNIICNQIKVLENVIMIL
ncbi:unnamed protein product [Paramecium octaurelia]|uniref:Uncharacterized protein n=1 Tax=Paramecium octaurelia TaxID=43137 RepID=A0A8S1UYY0_PAROT|nr:unnamed protein product [Paramecium octaurelia]CAD8168759.1 unnamed protein product [Paramecium octaurelia]